MRLKEITAALEAVVASKYYRKIVETGTAGSYRHASGLVNKAVNTMAERVEKFSRCNKDVLKPISIVRLQRSPKHQALYRQPLSL